MKKEWNSRAKADHKYFISYSNNDEEFSLSGKDDLDAYVVPILDKIVQNRNPKDLKVLEIGCGAGRVVKWLSTIFGEVYGIDISEEMINQAKIYCNEIANVTEFSPCILSNDT